MNNTNKKIRIRNSLPTYNNFDTGRNANNDQNHVHDWNDVGKDNFCTHAIAKKNSVFWRNSSKYVS